MNFETQIIKASRLNSSKVAPLTTPIHETTAFKFESAAAVEAYVEGRSDNYFYSRYENPTVEAVEKSVAELEGAEAGLIFSSGMGATLTTLVSLLESNDEIVCCSAIYGGTHRLLRDVLSDFGVRTRFVGLDELKAPADVLSEATRVLWFESPINPTLRCLDIAAISSACRERGVVSIIDNTFASPVNQSPLEMGVDICMHSATKYLNGHSDLIAGAIAGRGDLITSIGLARRLVGTVLAPQAAYALGRGLKTLSVRIERHNANALKVANFLELDRRVARVYYPGLTSHPDHEIASRQMHGFGGIVCLDLDGGLQRASAFFDRLKVFARAVSLGGVESLCSLPVLTSHYGLSEDELRAAGVSDGMVRLSVGLEDSEDLLTDLDQALG